MSSVVEDPSPPRRRLRNAAERVTTRFLTKHERAAILGTRASQLSKGAPATTSTEGETDCLRVAEKELRERTLPLVVRRFLPDDTYEEWKIDELVVDE